MSESRLLAGALDLVIDIGKTRAKLQVIDAAGQVAEMRERPSRTLETHGYRALDTGDIAQWMAESIASLGELRPRLTRAIVTTHGAAFALIDDDGLVLPVSDYEFSGFNDRAPDWSSQIGGFSETLSPDLPLGLNGATQLDWIERHHTKAAQRGQWLPYAQYWSWYLSGVASSEVTSLGCHTHLWNPSLGNFSDLARTRGWATRFAPVHKAWDVLGSVRPDLAKSWGLSRRLLVHCGVHDSNACLARYLRSSPRLTLVSTGTWIVIMAPGAPARQLNQGFDCLGNVSVRNERVPTGRFMGGREMQQICAGADPALANLEDLGRLLERGLMVLPGFARQGGPFRNLDGQVIDAAGQPVELTALSPGERATLGALYCAQVTAWIIDKLGGIGPIVVDGPFSDNGVYVGALSTLQDEMSVYSSNDPLEGTARGAHELAHWTEPAYRAANVKRVLPVHAAKLHSAFKRWKAHIEKLLSPVDGPEQEQRSESRASKGKRANAA